MLPLDFSFFFLFLPSISSKTMLQSGPCTLWEEEEEEEESLR